MKKILYICCGKFQKKIIKFINKKYRIIGIDENDQAEAKYLVNKFYNLKIQNTLEIYKKLKKYNFCAILSLNSDVGFQSANKLSQMFNLHYLPKKISDIFFKKSKLNIFLRDNNFPVKKFFYGKSISYKKNYIYKPNSNSGSRGIFISNNKRYFLKNFISTKNISNDKLIFCQENIEGKEFVFDCLVYKHEIIDFVISEKIKVNNQKFVSQTILYSSLNKKKRTEMIDLVNNFINKLNITFGIFHFEILKDRKNIFYIIDVAPRGPGFFVIEDYINKIASRNWINDYLNMLTNNFNIDKFKPKIKKPYLVHFLITKKGKFRNLKINKIKYKYKLEKFINNNTFTNAAKEDSNRIASIIISNKDKKKLINDLKMIKKSIVALY